MCSFVHHSSFFQWPVLVLALDQVFLYGMMVVSMPLFWVYPGIHLVGSLDFNWVYRSCAPPRLHDIICFANYILMMPAYWLQVDEVKREHKGIDENSCVFEEETT